MVLVREILKIIMAMTRRDIDNIASLIPRLQQLQANNMITTRITTIGTNVTVGGAKIATATAPAAPTTNSKDSSSDSKKEEGRG